MPVLDTTSITDDMSPRYGRKQSLKLHQEIADRQWMTRCSGYIARLQTQISQPETTFQHRDLEKDTFLTFYISIHFLLKQKH